MDNNALMQRSVEIITEYYKGNLKPYFESIDDHFFWLGPARGQMLCGKQQVMEAWAKEQNDLTFAMNDIHCTAVTNSKQFCEVLVTGVVFAHYPSGSVLRRDQRLQYTWCERRLTDAEGRVRREPRLLMLHISNSMSYDERDSIYPVHYEEAKGWAAEMTRSENGARLVVHGMDRSTYYLMADQVMWVESAGGGLHAKVHLHRSRPPLTETLAVQESVSALAVTAQGLLVRAHESYLINPMYAYNLRRFVLEMNDGTVIAVPQKRYTRLKRELERWAESWPAAEVKTEAAEEAPLL